MFLLMLPSQAHKSRLILKIVIVIETMIASTTLCTCLKRKISKRLIYHLLLYHRCKNRNQALNHEFPRNQRYQPRFQKSHLEGRLLTIRMVIVNQCQKGYPYCDSAPNPNQILRPKNPRLASRLKRKKLKKF